MGDSRVLSRVVCFKRCESFAKPGCDRNADRVSNELPSGASPTLTSGCRYRPAEKYYADLVEVWLPYFEHLMKVYRLLCQTKEKQIGKKLQEKGYDSDAIRIVVHRQPRTRTAISGAIKFVAFRNNLDENAIDEDTIRTAHSRIYGRIRKNLPAMTFPGPGYQGK
jgi:hypothetical protein